jgi:hypothetical protein
VAGEVDSLMRDEDSRFVVRVNGNTVIAPRPARDRRE